MCAGQGAPLFYEVKGSGPRITLIHGFTQNHRCWGPVAADLSRDHELVLVDAPGHGRSAGVEVSFTQGAILIGDAGGAGTYLGYSMGGRYALALALERPDLVERLVIIGAAPGIDDSSERERRRDADDALASRIGELGIASFLEQWLAQPLFAGLDAVSACVEERLDNDPGGLQSSLRLAGSGAQPSLWPHLGGLDMPVLVLTGSLDEKFGAIADEMVEAIGPNARHLVVASAGHTAHLENPDGFLSILRAWLRARSGDGEPGQAGDGALR